MRHDPFRARLQDGRLLVVEGPIDDDSLEVFAEHLQQLVEGGGGTVDVSAATFFPSMAIAAFVRCRRAATATGRRLDLKADPGSIAHRVLVVTGLLEA